MDASNIQRIIWHTEILPAATKKAINYLANANWLKKTKWYLAGGTALALQVGHRSSVDLDFFLPQKDFSAAKLINHFSKNI
ncbi:nucleotidyl transferase AbiEii/AbiGii toxin family protein [Candidatus Peregrinibacteria bacterium]|nr:nucleotidyl transferase AbiEii/AbiGii toxin family protein [Candidatus Peregrinibacteria bacterium]